MFFLMTHPPLFAGKKFFGERAELDEFIVELIDQSNSWIVENNWPIFQLHRTKKIEAENFRKFAILLEFDENMRNFFGKECLFLSPDEYTSQERLKKMRIV